MVDEVRVTEEEARQMAQEAKQGDNPAPSSSHQQEEGTELLAGKFKSVEELAKAYKELESKLGSRSQDAKEAAQDEGKDGDNGKADPSSKTENQSKGGDPYSAYGDAVASALKAAEVDPVAAQQEWEETGTLSEETFAKFEKAGFSREVVESYLRGVAASQQTATDMQEMAAKVKDIAGGPEEYDKMRQWMAASLPAERIEEFNKAIESGDFATISAAVAKAAAEYKASIGVEGRIIGGAAPASGGYASEAELLEDMRNPKYKTSEAFRQQVAAKLAASPNLFKVR